MGFHAATIATVPPGASLSIVGTVPTTSGADSLLVLYNADEITTPLVIVSSLTSPLPTTDLTQIDTYRSSSYDLNTAAIWSYTANGGAGFPASGGPTTYTFTAPSQSFPSTSLLLLSWTGTGVTPTAAQSTVIASAHVCPTTATLTGCACNPGDEIFVFVAGDAISASSSLFTISATGFTAVSSGGDGYSPVAVLASNATASGSSTGSITINIADAHGGTDDFGGVIAWVVAMPPAGGGGGGSSSPLKQPQRRSADDYPDESAARRRVAAFQVQTAAAAVLARRRISEDIAADEQRRVKLARVPPATQAWSVLAPQKRAADEQPEIAQRAAARFVAAAAATAAQPVLSLQRRSADELVAEEKRVRAASAPAPLVPGVALSQARRAQDDAPAGDSISVRRFVGAPIAAIQATALPGPRRAVDDAINEAQHLARAAVFAPVAQAVSAVLAQPKRNTEMIEEERPQRRGFVSSAVAQVVSAVLAQPKRNAEALDEERPQRKGFVSSAVAQVVSAVLAQPKRNAEALDEERPQRRGFAVAQAPNVVLARPKRNAEALEEERPQRKGFVSSAVAQVVSVVLAQPRRNTEVIEEERAVRRAFWGLVIALFPSLGGTVRVNERAQSVSLSAEQIQQVAATAQAQSVTIEGVESMYYVNTRTRMTFTFADFDGTPTDPTVVSLLIDGATVTPTRKSAGVWYYDYLPTSPGPKSYVITGTGAIAATRPGKIMVLSD